MAGTVASFEEFDSLEVLSLFHNQFTGPCNELSVPCSADNSFSGDFILPTNNTVLATLFVHSNLFTCKLHVSMYQASTHGTDTLLS